MATYDASILEKLADELYDRATGLVVSYGLFGFVFGGIAGLVAGSAARVGDTSTMLALVVALVGALGGIAVGKSKGAALRIQAQELLCQVQIEKHLRFLAVDALDQRKERGAALLAVAS